MASLSSSLQTASMNQANTGATSRTIEESIQALPQEMQDIILDFAIAGEPHQTNVYHLVASYNAYKPPLGLRINRKIRAAFARTHYGDNIFCFTFQGPAQLPWLLISKNFLNQRLLQQWLDSLDPCHRSLIKTICLKWKDSDRTFIPDTAITRRRADTAVDLYSGYIPARVGPGVFVFRLPVIGGHEWYRLILRRKESGNQSTDRRRGKPDLLHATVGTAAAADQKVSATIRSLSSLWNVKRGEEHSSLADTNTNKDQVSTLNYFAQLRSEAIMYSPQAVVLLRYSRTVLYRDCTELGDPLSSESCEF